MSKRAIKDFLGIIFVVSFSSIPPAIALIVRGDLRSGISLLLAALIFGGISLAVAIHWHKQDIHITRFGFWAVTMLFAINPFAVWLLGFSLWLNMITWVYWALSYQPLNELLCRAKRKALKC